jgi:phage gp29-like protein
MVTTAIERTLADDALYEDWLRPVDLAIKAALADLPEEPGPGDELALQERIDQLLQDIPRIYGEMATDRLESDLASAMFAADTNGRLERTTLLE